MENPSDKEPKLPLKGGTEEKILEAARKVFLEKGWDGARMQVIADEAGINKALLHYYFRSKEKLFKEVFNQQRMRFFPKLASIVHSEDDLFETIRKVVETQIEIMGEEPNFPLFLLYATSRNPDLMDEAMVNQAHFKAILSSLQKKMDQAESENQIRKGLNSRDILINCFSLSMYPIVARPLLQRLFQIQDETYSEMVFLRKQSCAEFIISAIRK